MTLDMAIHDLKGAYAGDYNKQLAEWLEELKMLRKLKNEHRKIGNIEGYNQGYKEANNINAPVAYDVDKVVEQLEERKSLYQRLQKLQDRDCLQYGYKIETLNDAIEIVKAGRRMTNAERIRNMSDEELADFIVGLNLHCLAGFGKCDCRANKTCDNCNVEVKKWLQQKSEG